MKYLQEKYARDLYEQLVAYFATVNPAVKILIEGAGVNWKCTAEGKERSSIIHCFNYPKDGHAEYLASFDESGRTIVWGRTELPAEVIQSNAAWLSGKSVADLEAQFAFVDATSRRLSKISDDVLRSAPAVQQTATWEIKRYVHDLCELWFVQHDRACKISFYGKNAFPDATFYWDKCQLFEFSANDNRDLAAVIQDWLCAHAMPSVMRPKYPWLEIGELADYYEHGNPVEGEFIMSWNSTESFYESVKIPQAKEILKLVCDIRNLGYDRTLRAGTSMFDLILSRSRRHGLRLDQPRVCFMFPNKAMEVLARFKGDEKYSFAEIRLQPPIDVLLRRLAEVAID